MRSLSFVIPGRLGGWKRAETRGKQRYTDSEMRSDQAMVRQFAVLAMRADGGCKSQLTGPLRMVVQTSRQPPASWSIKKRMAARWIVSTPDYDNTLKLIGDALNNVAYLDDRFIADGRHVKRYAADVPEQVRIDIEELEEQS